MVHQLQTSPVRTHRPRTRPESALTSLILNLERAVGEEDARTTAEAVSNALEAAIQMDGSFIPERFLQPVTHGYARRLIHMGSERRFSLLAMVWQPGQGTPLHDHGGEWCVECVYRGEMRSSNYSLLGERDGVFQFRQGTVVREIEGQSSALVPPFDHHVLDNPSHSVAVTLHVYAHELLTCNAYLPVEGGYSRKGCKLGYSE